MADSKSARPTTRDVKNLQSVPLFLFDMEGDDVQIPVGATVPVERRFLDYQMPSMGAALVIGYDYVTHTYPDDPTDEPEATPVEAAIAANTVKDAEPVVTDPTPAQPVTSPVAPQQNNNQNRPNNNGGSYKGSN